MNNEAIAKFIGSTSPAPRSIELPRKEHTAVEFVVVFFFGLIVYSLYILFFC